MRAKIENCINKMSGIFVHTFTIGERVKYKKQIERIIYVMRRHHYYKDFNMPTCSMRAMVKHDVEYAELMGFFVRVFWKELRERGYTPQRGDGVGFCYTSYNEPFLMYGVGNLYYKRIK